jgi:hypothetical protein
MKTIFYITDEALTCYHDNDSQSQTFSWQEIDAIDEYLVTLSEQTKINIVLDILDEDISFEWAPSVFPWEKKALQNRKKARVIKKDTALAEVHWTNVKQVNTNGRKEELMLTATVSDSFHLKNFFNNIEQAQLTVSSIYSKPLLLESYLKSKVRTHLNLTRQSLNRPLLMVTRQSKNTFRQTFFYHGELRISRLVEIDSTFESIAAIRSALINETKLAITYVYNQQIVPFNTPIGLIFIDGDEAVLEGMLSQCKEQALIRSDWEDEQYIFHTALFSSMTADGVICGSNGAECFSQEAIVDYILSESPKGFYLTPYIQKINNLSLSRQIFVGINVLLFLGGFVYILISGVNTLVSWQKQALLEQSIAQHTREIDRLQSLVKMQDDAQQIKASVEFSESILKLKVDRLINFDLKGLSQIIGRHPNIQISKIDWKTLNRFDSKQNQLDFSAWVFPFHETYQKPVKRVDEFIKDLNSLPGIEAVELQKEPLNRVLSQTLLIDAKMGDVEALPFTVRVRVSDVESN